MSQLAWSEIRKSPKGASGRDGRHGPKVIAPYPGEISAVRAEEKSAEAVVVRTPRESGEERRAEEPTKQTNQPTRMEPARRTPKRTGAATAAATEFGGETEGSGSAGRLGGVCELDQPAKEGEKKVLNEHLMERVMREENLRAAYQTVKANKGAPGIDHMTTEELGDHLKVERKAKGAPQGGPLSPLLGNFYLDQLDKELESRGVAFCRYADDITIYAKSQRSAERIYASITRWIERNLKLEVNREKSGVRPPSGGSFPGLPDHRRRRDRAVAEEYRPVQRARARSLG